jgi:hypothetical protein
MDLNKSDNDITYSIILIERDLKKKKLLMMRFLNEVEYGPNQSINSNSKTLDFKKGK